MAVQDPQPQPLHRTSSCPYIAPQVLHHVQNLIKDLYKSTVAKITPSWRMSVSPLFLVDLCDGRKLVLKAMPNTGSRLLRCDVNALANESVLLLLLQAAMPDLPVQRLLAPFDPTSPFLLMSCLPETSLGSHGAHHRKSGTRELNEKLGSILARTASITPVSKHGVAAQWGPLASPSFATWEAAFLALLESLLQDAEDAMVVLPYDLIRSQGYRHASTLLDVQTPRLVMPGLDISGLQVALSHPEQLVGIVCGDNSLWGDPFFAPALLARSQDEAFMTGWGQEIEMTSRSRTRALLYSLYHSICAILRSHYGESSELTSAREIHARKKLMTELNSLVQTTENSG